MENLDMKMVPISNLEQVLTYSRTETDKLLEMYAKYKALGEKIKEVPTSVFSRKPGKISEGAEVRRLKYEQVKLGNQMKFQNPLIWMMYKYEAYKDEGETSISTLESLRTHCKVDGICARRYDFINAALRQKNRGEDLTRDEFLAANTDLSTVTSDQRFINLSLDPQFMTEWSRHENDKAGKWKNYKKA